MDAHAQGHATADAADSDPDREEVVAENAPDLGGAIGIMVSETGGALAGVGLTHAQFVLLLAVSEFEPVPIEFLGRVMAVGERRRQGELAPLVSKGIVALLDEQTPECTVVTTAHGRSLLQRAIPLWEAAQGRIQERLGVEDEVVEPPRRSPKKPIVIG